MNASETTANVRRESNGAEDLLMQSNRQKAKNDETERCVYICVVCLDERFVYVVLTLKLFYQKPL